MYNNNNKSNEPDTQSRDNNSNSANDKQLAADILKLMFQHAERNH
jgi:hypothetical protein